MSDVAIKPVANEPVHNGWATVYVTPLGVTDKLQGNKKDDDITPSGLLELYGDRFDDTTYYTA